MLLLELANLITKTTEKVLLKVNIGDIQQDLSRISILINECEQELSKMEQKTSTDYKEYEQELLSLCKKHARLETLVSKNLMSKRDQLFQPVNASQPNLAGITAEPSQILIEHENLMQNQDEQLNQLSKIVTRQKDIGHLISNELDSQVQLLEDVEQQTEETRLNIGRTSNRLNGVVETRSKPRGKIVNSWEYYLLFDIDFNHCNSAIKCFVIHLYFFNRLDNIGKWVVV